MRVIVIGRCDRGMLKGMTGKDLAVLEGTVEELRAAAQFLCSRQEVDLVARSSVTSSTLPGGSDA